MQKIFYNTRFALMRTHFITDKGLFGYKVPYSYIQDCRNPTPSTVQLNTTLVWVFHPRAMQCNTIHETVCNPRKDFYFYHVCSKLVWHPFLRIMTAHALSSDQNWSNFTFTLTFIFQILLVVPRLQVK